VLENASDPYDGTWREDKYLMDCARAPGPRDRTFDL